MNRLPASFSVNQFLAIIVVLLVCLHPSELVAELALAVVSAGAEAQPAHAAIAARVFGMSFLSLSVYAAFVVPLELAGVWKRGISEPSLRDLARQVATRNALIVVAAMGWLVLTSLGYLTYILWTIHRIG